MREDLTRILGGYLFEIYDNRTRYEIIHLLTNYFNRKVTLGEMCEAQVNDVTTPELIDEGILSFDVMYTEHRRAEVKILNLQLGGTHGNNNNQQMEPIKFLVKKHTLV